jgi:hypothetical protein
VQALVYAISVIVATVPEGLLVTLTVALALTAKRMHSRSVLVKNLQVGLVWEIQQGCRWVRLSLMCMVRTATNPLAAIVYRRCTAGG